MSITVYSGENNSENTYGQLWPYAASHRFSTSGNLPYDTLDMDRHLYKAILNKYTGQIILDNFYLYGEKDTYLSSFNSLTHLVVVLPEVYVGGKNYAGDVTYSLGTSYGTIGTFPIGLQKAAFYPRINPTYPTSKWVTDIGITINVVVGPVGVSPVSFGKMWIYGVIAKGGSPTNPNNLYRVTAGREVVSFALDRSKRTDFGSFAAYPIPHISRTSTSMLGKTTSRSRVFVGGAPPNRWCKPTSCSLAVDPKSHVATVGIAEDYSATGASVDPLGRFIEVGGFFGHNLSKKPNNLDASGYIAFDVAPRYDDVGATPPASSVGVLVRSDATMLDGSVQKLQYVRTLDYTITKPPPVPPPPPDPPTDFTATSGPPSGITLEWEHAAAATHAFRVFRRTVATDPWVAITTTPTGTTSHQDLLLEIGTTYYYTVAAIMAEIESEKTAEASAQPMEPLPAPSVPQFTSAVAIDHNIVSLAWEASTGTVDGYKLYRAGAPEATPVLIGTVGGEALEYTDETVAGDATFYYYVAAFNVSATSAYSDPAEVTTPSAPGSLQPVSRFSLTPGCNLSMCQVAGRVLVFSDLDRPVVYTNRKWFQQGLKPLRKAPLVTGGGSGKMTGTVAAFVCLFRSDDVTRSIPSPQSGWRTLASSKVTVTLHADERAEDGSVISRDIGYDQSGQQIAGCDYWEIYLTEEDIAGAYLVARVPITQSSFTVDYEVGDLLDGSHRPMETANQSLIPPACAYSVYRNSRVYIFGERTIKPTQDDADATITMANASRLFSTSDYTLTDALYHKELYINKTGTGWFVVDVIDANNAEIMHFDPEINKGGFQGASGTYSDFAFAGKPSRVYASAYFSGEASGGITFSPETYPPTTIFEDEFDPDDNQDGNGAIASRDAIFFFKPSKAFFITGGETPDFPLLGVTTISRGSGLLAPKTLCRDRYDHIYYLSDQGPHMAHQGGVEKIGTMSGNAFLFQRYFDVGTAGGAVGTWFSRDDYFVVFGLNRRGRSGGRDGFIYDSRTNQICPFTTPKRITSCVQTTTDSGDYQLLVGDENGHVGTFLTADVYGDLRDYGSVDPLATEEVVPCFIRSGLIAAQRGLTPQWFVPRVKMIPDDATPLAYTVGFDGKTRSDDPTTYAADVSRTVTTALTNRVRVGGRRMQNCVVGFEFNAPTDGRVEWSGLEVTLNVQGTS